MAVLREFKAEASRLRSEIEQYEAIKTILRGTESEFELLATQFGLRSRTDETSRSILNWLIVLRGELSTLRSEQSRMLKELANERRAREDADTLRRNNATLTERCTSLKSRIEEMKREHRVEVERIRSIARKLMRARGEKSSTAAAVSNVSKSSDSSCVSDAIRLCVESPAPRSLITPLASRHAAENDSLVDLVDDDDDLLESLSAKQVLITVYPNFRTLEHGQNSTAHFSLLYPTSEELSAEINFNALRKFFRSHSQTCTK